MKTIALIPFWYQYNSNFNKIEKNPLLKIGGHSLINYPLKLLIKSRKIDEIYLYADTDMILKNIQPYIINNKKFKFIIRPKQLNNNKISIDKIIETFLKDKSPVKVVMVNPNVPFITKTTLNSCINLLNFSEGSVFTSTKINKLAWYKNKPLNFSLQKGFKTPKPFELEPILFEHSSLYVFTSEFFHHNKRRVTQKSIDIPIDQFEGLEIKNKNDVNMANLLINAGFYKQ